MTPDKAARSRSWLGTAVSAGATGVLMLLVARGPITSYLDTGGALVLAAAVILGAVGVRTRERTVRPATLAVSMLCVAATVIVGVGLFAAR